ncbi:MAG: hypothetical protein Q9227_009000 [Pyrenula ochraceoflavens]
MTDLGPVLARLGLDQYLDAFVQEGFDSWKTLLDIQESDLAIAEERGLLYGRALGSPALESLEKGDLAHQSASTAERGGNGGPEPKRKYRRHPKPDENAPERPPSAYVIFSNKIRDEVKSQNLSFTEIAKLVGERWQTLTPAEKEPYETQANSAKETYITELAKYKKTDSHKKYLQYLAEFKAKHGGGSVDSKRPKLDKEDSGGSGNSSVPETQEPINGAPNHGHARITSLASSHTASQATTLPSPTTDNSGPPIPPGSSQLLLLGHGVTGSPRVESPPVLGYRDSRPLQMPPSLPSQHSSASDVSMRSLIPSNPPSISLNGYSSESSAASRPWSLLQHQDTSASSRSSYSYGSGCSAQAPFASQSSTEESPWLRRMSSTDGPPAHNPADLPPLVHPPLPSHTAANHPSHPTLPPLKAPESMSRRLPDPNTRVLPPPTLSPLESNGSFRTAGVSTPVQRQNVVKDSPKGSEGSRSPMESSENEAANSLAALAYGMNRPGSRRNRSG